MKRTEIVPAPLRFCGWLYYGCGRNCSWDQPDNVSVLDQLGSLLDKSLLREIEGMNEVPVLVMLETLREFGVEQLKMSGEQGTI